MNLFSTSSSSVRQMEISWRCMDAIWTMQLHPKEYEMYGMNSNGAVTYCYSNHTYIWVNLHTHTHTHTHIYFCCISFHIHPAWMHSYTRQSRICVSKTNWAWKKFLYSWHSLFAFLLPNSSLDHGSSFLSDDGVSTRNWYYDNFYWCNNLSKQVASWLYSTVKKKPCQ